MEESALILDLTPNQRRHLEELSRQRGYESPVDYVIALIELDAELAEEPLTNRFRRSLGDALSGKTYPISSLWDDMDDE